MKKIFFLFFLFVSLVTLYPKNYKLTGKFIRLEVNDRDGRFLLYGRKSEKDEWIPLLFEDFPSTSYFRFFSNKKDVGFGSQGAKAYAEINIDKNKIVYLWRNESLSIVLVYQLVSSIKSGFADTLLIDVTVKNIGYSTFNLDYFFCLDTYLGEKSGDHILFNSRGFKAEFSTGAVDRDILITSFSKELNLGVNIFLPEQTSLPTKLFFANWKRVEQSLGLFNLFPKRSFDMEPYSINDSSVFFEYSSQQFKPMDEKNYRYGIKFITDNADLFKKVIVAKSDGNDIKSAVDEINDNNLKLSDEVKSGMQTTKDKQFEDINRKALSDLDIAELLKLLDEINRNLESKTNIDEGNVKLINDILTIIKKKRGY